jgi:hypothetical protein
MSLSRNKYRNRKTTIDGHTFDSQKEAARFAELKMLERAGEISELELQPRFLIVPKVRWQGRTLRQRYYVADFAYYRKSDSKRVVEDVKGMRTDMYTLKRQLFLVNYGEHYTFIET